MIWKSNRDDPDAGAGLPLLAGDGDADGFLDGVGEDDVDREAAAAAAAAKLMGLPFGFVTGEAPGGGVELSGTGSGGVLVSTPSDDKHCKTNAPSIVS